MKKNEKKLIVVALFKAVRLYNRYEDAVHADNYELRTAEYGIMVNDKYLLPWSSIQFAVYE